VKRIVARGVKTGCLAPLVSQGRALGVISMVSLRDGAFSAEDAELLTQIAGQIAIAVENALNFERARAAEETAKRESKRVQLLLEMNNAVVSTLDLRELVKAVSASLRDIMPHDSAGIALYDSETNHLREFTNVSYKDVSAFREGDVIPLEGTPAGQVFLTGRPLLIRRPDLSRYPADRYSQLPDSQLPAERTPKSACLAPLIIHVRKLGIAGVSSTQEDSFSDEDLEVFNQIAAQIAIAVENSLAFHEIEALKNKLNSEKLYLEAE